MPKIQTIHTHIKERSDLAAFYAEDGAFHSASRILSELAAFVKTHAEVCDAAMAEITGDEGKK